MNCNQVRRHFSEYIDGACGEAVSRSVEAHVEGCPACSQALNDMRLAVRAVNSLPPVEAPPNFRAKVWSQIGDRTPARVGGWALFVHRLSWKPVAAFGGAVALAGVIGFSMLAQRSVETPSAETPFMRTTTEAHTDFVSSSPTVLDQSEPEVPSAVDVGAM
jgi:anti-sigma factor (TIGR02949 family)